MGSTEPEEKKVLKTPRQLRRGLSLRIPENAFSSGDTMGSTEPEEEKALEKPRLLRRVNSLRMPSNAGLSEADLGGRLRYGGSLRIKSLKKQSGLQDNNLLCVPPSPIPRRRKINRESTLAATVSTPTVTISAPTTEHLARNLLQFGCPAVSIQTPCPGDGTEHLPSSDSEDVSVPRRNQQGNGAGGGTQGQTQRQGQCQSPTDKTGPPKVNVFGPSSASTDSMADIDGSAGSIGVRSVPSTPVQPSGGQMTTGPQATSGPQSHTSVGAVQSQPPKSPNHVSLKRSESQLSKPLSRSTPSMANVTCSQTTTTTSKTSTKSSPTSTSSSARQKKFHRHFSQSSKFCDQVTADERVLNYYSCALVGDILLQGHLYITPNYFAFYSNVFGYVTKLLIPITSVSKISKEKTARIIPNAIAVVTEEERHVFCSLLSRDSTFKLMKQVWDAVVELRSEVVDAPSPDEAKLLPPEALRTAEDSEVNPEEDDSSMSESGNDLASRSPTICTDSGDILPVLPVVVRAPSGSPNPSQDQVMTVKPSPARTKQGSLKSLFTCTLKPGTVLTVLVAVLAALYVSAALMMVRIDKLHTAYINHPLASPERFTQDQLLRYLNTNLDQIVKVRQSLQMLSQQFISVTQSRGSESSSGRTVEPEDAPS